MPARLLLTFFLAFTCAAQDAGVLYKVLYSSDNTGLRYLGNMLEARPGLFYGVGGSSVLFSITSEGTFKEVYTVPGASNNYVGSLVQSTNGKLYGTGGSANGNYYFSIATSGQDFQQYMFPSQWGSLYTTIVVPPNYIYDLLGGYTGYDNNIYELARIDDSAQVTLLHQFSVAEGVPNPYSNLVYALDGNIYGIGNQSYNEVSSEFIYRFTPFGAYSRLVNFSGFTGGFNKQMVAGSDGNLYGSVQGFTTGLLFEASQSGQAQVLADFQMGFEPDSLVQASDGNLYGSTNTSSYIFRYDLAQQRLSAVYQLPLATCYCQLIQGMDGKLYGVGTFEIFSLNLGLPKPLPLISGLYPNSGPTGQKVILWGNYLLGPTSVTFNGVAATDPVATSIRSVRVTVPPGATTGPVTITTANGTYTTTQPFTVE